MNPLSLLSGIPGFSSQTSAPSNAEAIGGTIGATTVSGGSSSTPLIVVGVLAVIGLFFWLYFRAIK